MTFLFSYFTRSKELYFPGAAFIMGAFLTVVGVFMAMRSLKMYVQPAPKPNAKGESVAT